jgi:hypothetical protein
MITGVSNFCPANSVLNSMKNSTYFTYKLSSISRLFSPIHHNSHIRSAFLCLSCVVKAQVSWDGFPAMDILTAHTCWVKIHDIDVITGEHHSIPWSLVLRDSLLFLGYHPSDHFNLHQCCACAEGHPEKFGGAQVTKHST